MLTLTDARDGRPAVLGPAHPGELRLLISAAPGTGTVRALLTADLIRRAAERRGLLATLCHLADPAEDLAALRADCAALNVYPPEHTVPPAPPGGSGRCCPSSGNTRPYQTVCSRSANLTSRCGACARQCPSTRSTVSACWRPAVLGTGWRC